MSELNTKCEKCKHLGKRDYSVSINVNSCNNPKIKEFGYRKGMWTCLAVYNFCINHSEFIEKGK